MSDKSDKLPGDTADNVIRRILVTFDDSAESITALNAGVNLAAALDAELVGLFVEDENLLRLSEFSFTRAVAPTGLYGGLPGRGQGVGAAFNRDDILRGMRRQAAAARHALERAAGARGVHFSFRISKGIAREEIRAALPGVDLLSLGKPRRGGKPVTEASDHMAQTSLGAVLFSDSHYVWPVHGPRLIVGFDGSACGRRAVAMAATLAAHAKTPAEIEVYLLGEKGAAARGEVERLLPAPDVARVFHTVPHAVGLMQALQKDRKMGNSLVIFGAECAPLADSQLADLICATHCEVMVVRG